MNWRAIGSATSGGLEWARPDSITSGAVTTVPRCHLTTQRLIVVSSQNERAVVRLVSLGTLESYLWSASSRWCS